jgi:stress response protein SCP2
MCGKMHPMSLPTSSVTLAKGGNASLAADEIRLALSWSPGPSAPDIDVSAFLCGASGKVATDDDFVFYNQPRHPSESVTHAGKSTVAGRCFDTLTVGFARLPGHVQSVALSASSEDTFGHVSGLELNVYDAVTGAHLLRFPMAPQVETAIIAGELYRRIGSWKFRAVAQGYTDGLAALARDFGIGVDDAPPPAPTPAPSHAAIPPASSRNAQIDWLKPPIPAGYEM